MSLNDRMLVWTWNVHGQGLTTEATGEQVL